MAGLLVAAEGLVRRVARAAGVLPEDGGDVLQHDSAARCRAAVRQRAPPVSGVAHGRHHVDGELPDVEGNELNVGDVVDALEVGLLQDEGERAQVGGDVRAYIGRDRLKNEPKVA